MLSIFQNQSLLIHYFIWYIIYINISISIWYISDAPLYFTSEERNLKMLSNLPKVIQLEIGKGLLGPNSRLFALCHTVLASNVGKRSQSIMFLTDPLFSFILLIGLTEVLLNLGWQIIVTMTFNIFWLFGFFSTYP